MSRQLLFLSLLVAMAGIASAALAGPLRGSVRLPEASEAPRGDDHYWQVWNGFIDPPNPQADASREVAVVLTGEGDSALGCEARIVGGDFLPKVVTLRPGAELQIENRDGCSHELQSDDIPGFAPIATAPGNARGQIQVPAGGPYTISDRLYEHVGATVHVVEDLVACASVSSRGEYVFENITPGTYTLRVFRGAQQVHESPVEIIGDAALTLDPVAIGAGGEE